jgi:hypothetical protein
MFGLICLLAPVLGAGSSPPPQVEEPSLAPPAWVEVAPGIEFARVEALRFTRDGRTGVAVVRLDPARCRLEPWHETEFPGENPATIEVWRKRLDAPIVFNAGLYDENRRHLGTIQRDGTDLPSSPHQAWKGVLVWGGEGTTPPARLLDLEEPEDRDQVSTYPTLVQSMMLFDRSGRLRVRRSAREAARTVVAEDGSGNLLVVVTEGRFTLWETAVLLQDSGLDLVQAMALDGGRESNLVVEAENVRYTSSAGNGPSSADQILRATAVLPAVVAVRPREARP